MAPGALSSQYGLMWWLETDRQGETIWEASGYDGQLIAVVPDRQLVVTIASVPTKEFIAYGTGVLYFAINSILPAQE